MDVLDDVVWDWCWDGVGWLDRERLNPPGAGATHWHRHECVGFDRLASAPECHGRPVVAGSPRDGLGLGSSVLAFPIAEDAAPAGQTGLIVAIVNTTGTVTGGVMSVVSGLILEASGPGDLNPVLVVYGLFGLFGVAVAAWIQCSGAPAQSAA